MPNLGERKKILVLTSTFPRWVGDTEPPFVLELCKNLSGQYKLLVLAPHAAGTKLKETIADIEVQRFRYAPEQWETLCYRGGIIANLKTNKWRYLLLPVFVLAQLLAIFHILRKENISLIHAHWLIPQGFTATFAAMLSQRVPPLVCTSHGGDIMGLNRWPLMPIKRWVIRCSSVLTVVSRAMETEARKLGATSDQLHTISMGVDTTTLFNNFSLSNRANNKLLFVGRLVEKKGISYLIDAMPEILKSRPDTTLTIVGDGPLWGELHTQVTRLGLSKEIIFRGALSNINLPSLYNISTLFLAPSIVTEIGDQEGLGLVIVEALACECPVIASDLPAIHDVITHEKTGWFVPEKNSSAIAKAVLLLLNDGPLRKLLGINGRNHVTQKFDWSNVATSYAEVFDKVIY